MTQDATIGRKVHFYPGEDTSVHQLNHNDPLDATVIYVYGRAGSAQIVNLSVIDHLGNHHVRTSVPLIDDDAKLPTQGSYARWMPYQQQQAKLQANSNAAAESVAVTESTSDASATPSPSPDLIAPAAESQPVVANAPDQATETSAVCGFDEALRALKAGKAVTRMGWGSNVFIYMVPAASYKAQTGIAKKVFGENADVPYMAYLAIKRADGQVCVFNPGIDSILAEDWATL